MTLNTNKLKPEKTRHFAPSIFVRLALSMVIGLAAAGVVAGQTKPEPEGGMGIRPANKDIQPAKEKLPFTLRVTDDQIIGISLKAKDVPLKQIATELSRRLKIPVLVTTIMEKHLVTTNFSDLVIEPALQMLAPQVFIDYEIDSTPGKQPRPVGVYLQGYNERPPSESAVVRGNSDVMVIEGDTEDDGTAPDKADAEDELKVLYEKGSLSVRAKKEPLVVVLYGIANQLGIPLEVRNEVADLVTVNITRSSIEYALQQLGPNIRLYQRTDLQLQEKRPLRLVLVGPDKKS